MGSGRTHRAEKAAIALMDAMPQVFGIAAETESSWPEWLSETHIQFLADFCQRAQEREAAVVNQFLAAKERHR